MKKVKFITSLLLSLLILSCVTINTYAYNIYPNNYSMTGGVGNYGANNRYYFLTPSATSYNTLVSAAVTSWVQTTSRLGITTPISIVKTTDQSASQFDIYLVAMSGDYNTIAQTDWYVSGTNVTSAIGQPTRNWAWSKINLNSNALQDPNYPMTTFDKQGTIAHEFGHTMGLAHSANTNVVMCQLGAGRYVNLPQSDDANGINYKY